MTFNWNDPVVLTAFFRVNKVLTDPTGSPAVALVVKDPNGVTTIYDSAPVIQRVSTGVWAATLSPPHVVTGTRKYTFEFLSFGAAQGGLEDSFVIAPTALPTVEIVFP